MIAFLTPREQRFRPSFIPLSSPSPLRALRDPTRHTCVHTYKKQVIRDAYGRVGRVLRVRGRKRENFDGLRLGTGDGIGMEMVGAGKSGREMLRRFALISDVHVFDSQGVWLENAHEFVGQRLLGLLNILLLRGPDRFSREVLAAAIADMKRQGVQHLVCAGDVTNLSIECEFRAAAAYFEKFGSPRTQTFIPGNHDTYNRSQAKCALFNKYFGQYCHSDVWRVSPNDDGFPFLQLRGGVVFIGLNSGRPNTARGFIGPAQWSAARYMLYSGPGQEALAAAKLLVLVVHHPTQDPRARGLSWVRDLGHDLKDWREVAVFCREFGVDLCVHGHNHVPYRGRMVGSEDTYVYEGGSGTMLVEDPERIARYTVFELEKEGGLARTYARVWNLERERFETLELPLPEALTTGKADRCRELVGDVVE